MIDLFMVVTGVALIGTGLWWLSPAMSLVTLGLMALLIAYGRHRSDPKPKSPAK